MGFFSGFEFGLELYWLSFFILFLILDFKYIEVFIILFVY